MNAVSMNNLWAYLKGLALTSDNRQWLAEKLAEPVDSLKVTHTDKKAVKYRISPKRRKLMESVRIDPKDFEGDEKAQYILSK